MKTRILSVFALLVFLSLPLQAQVCGPDGCGPNGCLPSGMTPMAPFSPAYTPPPTRVYTPQTEPSPCVARVKIDCGSYSNYGTGTLIATNSTEGLVITNAHLFGNGTPRGVSVTFPEGNYKGSLLGKDTNSDLALIRIPKPKTYPVKIAPQGVKVGDRVRKIGWGQGQYRMTSGVVQSTGWSMMISGSSRDGDSGGPIINSDGLFVGVLWGTTNDQTAAVNLPQVKECAERFILPWNAQLEGQKTQAQAERDRALIDALQRSQGGTDPRLIQRIEALEVIAGQAQTYMESQGITALSPPITPTPVEQKPLEEPISSSSEKSGGGWSIGGVVLQPFYLWLGGLGIGGFLLAKFLKGTGLGNFLGGKSVDMAAYGVDKMTDLTPWKWDDNTLDPLAYKLAARLKGQGVKVEEPKEENK